VGVGSGKGENVLVLLLPFVFVLVLLVEGLLLLVGGKDTPETGDRGSEGAFVLVLVVVVLAGGKEGSVGADSERPDELKPDEGREGRPG